MGSNYRNYSLITGKDFSVSFTYSHIHSFIHIIKSTIERILNTIYLVPFHIHIINVKHGGGTIKT